MRREEDKKPFSIYFGLRREQSRHAMGNCLFSLIKSFDWLIPAQQYAVTSPQLSCKPYQIPKRSIVDRFGSNRTVQRYFLLLTKCTTAGDSARLRLKDEDGKGEGGCVLFCCPIVVWETEGFSSFSPYIAYNIGVTAVDKKAIPFFFFLSPDYFFPGEDDDRWRKEEIKEH